MARAPGAMGGEGAGARRGRRVAGAAVALLALGMGGCAPGEREEPRLPILDMHLHARTAAHYGPPPVFMCAPAERMPVWDPGISLGETLDALDCANRLASPETDEALFAGILEAMERWNVYGVLGGTPELVGQWMDAAPGRFIPALDFRLDRPGGTASAGSGEGGEAYAPISPDSLEALFRSGRVQVLAEVLNAYGGIAPDDPAMAPYWSLAERYDIPVGIHVGPGAPGEVYLGNAAWRVRLQSPLTMEEVLVRHPGLRVYLMHGGYPFLDDLLALLFSYPQVHVEVGLLANVEPRAAFHRWLRTLVEAGFVDRVLFGSDAMVWPGMMEVAIEAIQEADYLTDADRRAIFYGNAARFLRLDPEEVRRHHEGQDPPRNGGRP
jgi:uncharacterized protein